MPAELAIYKDKHFQARSETQYFLHYMVGPGTAADITISRLIANINNCYIFVELMLQLSEKYGQDPSLPKIDNHRLKAVGEEFHNLASQICDWLVDEVFLDLQILVNELLTREWLTNAHAVDTICVTLEDYCQDFVHLRDDFYEALMKKIQARLGREYLKALFSRTQLISTSGLSSPGEDIADKDRRVPSPGEDIADKDRRVPSPGEDISDEYLKVRTKLVSTSKLSSQDEDLARKYLKAPFSRKISFKSYDERFPAAEKISQEAEQLQQLFTQLIPQHQDDSPFEALPMLAEVIKLKDTSMMSLELSGLSSRYPDIRTDQLVSLLMIREDLGRSGSRQMVIDCLGEDHDTRAKSTKTVFSSL
ncbi:hypothetical protein NP493_9g03026 [Ridgeia piscesae]|uniref:Exocyst complex component Sec6 n=1 Tax=Ridgeia piscesae TaxID=27915 RepID=A0AAD9PFM9_RIDPI|nr:hypothetical protein NP493_9g03026 [Ridgeia piscesae]